MAEQIEMGLTEFVSSIKIVTSLRVLGIEPGQYEVFRLKHKHSVDRLIVRFSKAQSIIIKLQYTELSFRMELSMLFPHAMVGLPPPGYETDGEYHLTKMDFSHG